MSDNTVTVVGNVTRDPELKYGANGQARASLGLAVSRKWKKNDQWEEQTSFFNVTAWGDLAENVAESITKGARVVVFGRLEQRTWEKDGEKKSAVDLIADEVAPSLRWATCQVVRTERTNAPQTKATVEEEPF